MIGDESFYETKSVHLVSSFFQIDRLDLPELTTITTGTDSFYYIDSFSLTSMIDLI